MTITKKEISEKTAVTRGSGFNPRWKYYVAIEGVRFYKDFTDGYAYADDRWNNPLGECRTKKEFVNRVHEFIANQDHASHNP